MRASGCGTILTGVLAESRAPRREAAAGARMPMPRRFVVVSAVGLADCVEEADPYITMS